MKGNRNLRYTRTTPALSPSEQPSWVANYDEALSARLWDFAPHLYPFRKASPLETGMSPVSILNVVVLPAPLIPSSPKH